MLRYALIPDWLWSKRESHHLSLTDFLDVGPQGKLSRILCQADCDFYKVLNTDYFVDKDSISAQDYLELLGHAPIPASTSALRLVGFKSEYGKPLSGAGIRRLLSIQDWSSPDNFARCYTERMYHFFLHEDTIAKIHQVNPLFSCPIQGYTWECKGIVDDVILLVAVAIPEAVMEELGYAFPESSPPQQIQHYKTYRYIKMLEHILQAMNDTTHHRIDNHALLAVYIDTLAYGSAKVLQRLEDVFRVVDPSVLPEYTS